MLTGIVAHPDQRLEDAALTEAERYQLLVEWNTQADYSKTSAYISCLRLR